MNYIHIYRTTQGIKFNVLLDFENFQIVKHGFLDANFMKNIGFWLVFNAFKKVSGYFAIAKYGISRHFSIPGALSEYVYIYKVFKVNPYLKHFGRWLLQFLYKCH